MATAIAIAAVMTVVAAAAPGTPLAVDVSCKTAEDTRAYEECAGDCKDASDKRQRACNRGYRECRAKCSGAGKIRCRAACRRDYRACSKAQRGKLETCRADCLEDHGCKLVD